METSTAHQMRYVTLVEVYADEKRKEGDHGNRRKEEKGEVNLGG